MSQNPKIEIPPQLEKMLIHYTIKVLEDKPKDLTEHAATYFANLRSQKSFQTPDEIPDNEAIFEIRKLLGTRSGRRFAIVGPSMSPRKESLNSLTEPVVNMSSANNPAKKIPKTTEEKLKIKECMRNVFLFQSMSEQAQKEMVERMAPKQVSKDEVIIQQGEEGDSFYVIEEGDFDVFVTEKNDIQMRYVSSYEGRGYFGESALLCDEPRAATVRAATDGLLWSIDRDTFKLLATVGHLEQNKKYRQMMATVKELRPLSESERDKICEAMSPRSLKKGEVLFEEGSDSDGMYFILEGQMGARRRSQGQVKTMSKDDYFGEVSLMEKMPREATLFAMEDSKLAFLNVHSFERIMGPCIELLGKQIVTYEDIESRQSNHIRDSDTSTEDVSEPKSSQTVLEKTMSDQVISKTSDDLS